MEDLIMHSHELYGEPSHPSSPPLPPTPTGEPVPRYPYGSKTTKVTSVPPSTPTRLVGPHLESPPQDFTPRMPARPASSIHPSLRANPPTPSRGHSDAYSSSTLLQSSNVTPEESRSSSPSSSSVEAGENPEPITLPAQVMLVTPPSSSDAITHSDIQSDRDSVSSPPASGG